MTNSNNQSIESQNQNEAETASRPQVSNSSGSWKLRLRAVLVLIFVGGLIGTSIYLDPYRLEQKRNGYSFLPAPCGFLYKYHYPCPTCYMTRSFSYMMHGRPDKSFLAQPFGAMMCLMVLYLGWGGIFVLYTGKPWRPFWVKWPRKWLLTVFILAFLAGWIFRIGYGTVITHEFPFH